MTFVEEPVIADARDAAVSTTANRPGSFVAMFRNAGWLLGGKGVGALLSLVYLGTATRTLGPDRFGAFMLVLGIGQTIAAIATFQSWQVVIQYGMTHLRRGDRERLDRLVLFASALDLGSATLGGLLAIVATGIAASVLHWPPELARRSLLFCLVLLFSLRSAPAGLLRLRDRYAAGTLAETMTPVIRLLGAGVALVVEPTVDSFLAAWAAAEALTGLAYWWLAIRHADFPWRPGRWRSPAMVRADNPGIWRYALTTNMIATLAVAGKQASVVIVGFFVGATAAGAYRLCYQLAQAVAKASQMVARALFPELVRARSGDGDRAFAAMLRRSIGVSLGAGLVLLAIVWAVGSPVLTLVAGPAYGAQYPLLRLIGTAAALDLAAMCFEPALMSAGEAGVTFRIRTLATIGLLGAMAVLMPRYGVLGAGLSAVASSALSCALLGIATRRMFVRMSGRTAGPVPT